METEIGEAGIVEAKGRRGQGGNRKKAKRARKKKVEEKKGGRGRKGSREVGDLEQRRGSSKIRGRSKKIVPEKFHPWIKVFGKKQSERMLMRKVWDHTIEVKEGFVPRKRKVYPLSREEREEVHEFIKEQLRKEYIRLSKSPQMVLVFFVGKKDGKKRMV